jgi:ABC-type lipoprotein export system ATPase subunit
MNSIQLTNTLPDVFKGRTDIASDVWLKDLTFEKGKSYLIEANSGTGKSSLFSFLYGYRNDYQGQMIFDGHDINHLTIQQWTEIRRNHLSLLWQDLRLFPELTAHENVKIKNNLTHFQKKSTIDNWFDQLGIVEKKDTLVGKMSFGQQQRVALIRALCQPFDFILLDEPVSHLDDTNAAILADILKAEAKDQDAAIIVTSIGKRLDLEYDFILKL